MPLHLGDVYACMVAMALGKTRVVTNLLVSFSCSLFLYMPSSLYRFKSHRLSVCVTRPFHREALRSCRLCAMPLHLAILTTKSLIS